jgi:type II secretory pathway pseudopilin PulG
MILSRTSRRAHTLVEVMVAMALLTIGMGMAMGGWLYMVRGEKRNATQAELDMDVRKTIEQLRTRLRLSALEKVVFYRPPGAENYTAVSFPLAEDNDGDGLIEMEHGTNIIWDKTVIYHVWNQSPEQLLCTTFSPRNNSLNGAQLRQQLATTVASGNGVTAAAAGETASTVKIFENLFDWKLWPKGSRFDSYSATVKRELIPFGSVMIGPGAHTLSFKVTGRNGSSTGYRVGLDYVRASPSGSDREAEWQSIVVQPSSVPAVRQYMSQGSWSDNYQLQLQATATNQQMIMSVENDCWEDTTFRTPGASYENVSLKRGTFGSSLEENFISMDGYGYTWYSEYQMANPTNTRIYGVDDSGFDKCAIRVLLKGANIPDGGFISANGQYPYVLLMGPALAGGTYKRTKIRGISIGVADDSNGYNTAMNVKPGTLRYMTPQEDTFVGYVWAWPTTVSPYYQIQRTNTYAVTFYVETLGAFNNGSVAYRQDDKTDRIHAYVVPNAAVSDVYETNWTAKAGLYATNMIPVVYGLYTFYPSNGFYVSGIFDTTKQDPAFTEILWNQALGQTGSGYSDVPSGTALRFRVRSGDDPLMADAPSWTNATLVTASGGSLSTIGSGRYVQFRAQFQSDAWDTAKLRNVKVRWPGDPKLVDVSAMVTRGPDCGEFEVMVDGTNLYRGVRIDLSIFKDITGFQGKQERMTSAMMAEIEPRNTSR